MGLTDRIMTDQRHINYHKFVHQFFSVSWIVYPKISKRLIPSQYDHKSTKTAEKNKNVPNLGDFLSFVQFAQMTLLAKSQFMIICKLVKCIWSVAFRSVVIWRVDYLTTRQFIGIFLTWRNRWSSSTSPWTRPWRMWRRSEPSRPNLLLVSEKFRRRKSIETNKSCESSSQEEEWIVQSN